MHRMNTKPVITFCASLLLTACATTKVQSPKVVATMDQSQGSSTSQLVDRQELRGRVVTARQTVLNLRVQPMAFYVNGFENGADGDLVSSAVFDTSPSPLTRNLVDRILDQTIHTSAIPMSGEASCPGSDRNSQGKPKILILSSVRDRDEEVEREQQGLQPYGETSLSSSVELDYGNQRVVERAKLWIEVRTCDGINIYAPEAMEFTYERRLSDRGFFVFAKVGGFILANNAGSNYGANRAKGDAMTYFMAKVMPEAVKRADAYYTSKYTQKTTPTSQRLLSHNGYSQPKPLSPGYLHTQNITPRTSYSYGTSSFLQPNQNVHPVHNPSAVISANPYQNHTVKLQQYGYETPLAKPVSANQKPLEEIVVEGRRTKLPSYRYFPRSTKRDFKCTRNGKSCDMSFEMPRKGTLRDMETYLMRAARLAGSRNPASTCYSNSRRREQVICKTTGLGSVNWRDWRDHLYS